MCRHLMSCLVFLLFFFFSSLAQENIRRITTPVYIPVVFHILLPDPNIVTDAQIIAQLDTLNKGFSGTNEDSVNIPSYFKSLFGKSKIQFCLAKRTPDDEITSGINRFPTYQTFYGFDDMKHPSSGGVASWNSENYLNVWIINPGDNYSGNSTLPNVGSPDDQGIVINYNCLPGGSNTNRNAGKTLTHEAGHYFNLYHIWGNDDAGPCSGTDYVEDTPNQAGFSIGCYSGVITDSCTSSGNGIMYQNYMDYSYDRCLLLFTMGQVNRMEAALNIYRPALISSQGCQPASVEKNYDISLLSIFQPIKLLCNADFKPVVVIKNLGIQTIVSMQIEILIDNTSVLTFNWNGSLVPGGITSLILPSIHSTPGNHILTIAASNPNGHIDEEPTNDTLSKAFQYFDAFSTIWESFEGTSFPAAGWDIENPDGYITWEKASGIGKTGSSSVLLRNFDYAQAGQKDELRLPMTTIPLTVDSAFLSFQVAAAYKSFTSPNNVWDTLEVLVSKDCGIKYVSVYKKWGNNLVTKTNINSYFIPSPTEWRKDSIDLAGYIGQSNLIITFRNTTGYHNNLYLDDIRLRTTTINSNLKRNSFLVTPNPTNGSIAVQFYPQPSDLKSIEIYNLLGQQIAGLLTNGNPHNYYTFNLLQQPAGVYIIRVVFSDKILFKKIVKN